MIFISTRFRALNNIVHKCSHASFARVRGVNTTIEKPPTSTKAWPLQRKLNRRTRQFIGSMPEPRPSLGNETLSKNQRNPRLFQGILQVIRRKGIYGAGGGNRTRVISLEG